MSSNHSLVDEADLQKVRSFEQLVSAVSQIIAPIIGESFMCLFP